MYSSQRSQQSIDQLLESPNSNRWEIIDVNSEKQWITIQL
jgi:hypothetical protein